MKRFKVGTYDWSNATDTSINFREKVLLLGQLVASQVLNAITAVANKSGINNAKLARVDSRKMIIPDSSIAKAALEYAQDMYNVPLLNHCLRTYLWGILLGQYHNQQPDAEFLYVASLLHDAGLSSKNSSKINKCCFAVTGASDAKKFVESRGWEPSKSVALFNSISMHLNPIVSKTDNTEGFLIKSGAYMDLFGNGHTCIATAEKVKIIHQYPRYNFNEEILHVNHFPDSRAAYFAKFGAEELSRKNPLNKLESADAHRRLIHTNGD
ncbi:MAG: hypothetical protein ACRYFB_11975 [Janthinobacterium lividum]